MDVSMTAWAFASSGWASDELMAEATSERLLVRQQTSGQVCTILGFGG